MIIEENGLLPHQAEFVNYFDNRYVALVAGYGSGKTYAFCAKGILLASLNPGHRGAMLEPTNAMAADVLIPDLTAMIEDLGIPYSYKQSPYPSFKLYFDGGVSEILIRSAENYKRLAGLNLAWWGVDECDTIARGVAKKMWYMLVSRLRDGKAPCRQGYTTSTPEGFSFLHEYFVTDQEDRARLNKDPLDRHILHASTYDNPHLDDDFIPDLLEQYPPNLIQGYLLGKFTNLLTGNVYDQFTRAQNGTDKTIADFDDGEWLKDVHIGVDFNVGKTCGICHIIDDDGNPWAIDEITTQKNTDTLIASIKKKFPKRKVYVYPDASGRSEHTNASATDVKLLSNHFTVKAPRKNPPVRDRVNSMNAVFCNGDGEVRYRVNTRLCPKYTTALETQGYTDQGKPDKAHDQDHPPDASGYFIHNKFPIKRGRGGKITLTGH